MPECLCFSDAVTLTFMLVLVTLDDIVLLTGAITNTGTMLP